MQEYVDLVHLSWLKREVRDRVRHDAAILLYPLLPICDLAHHKHDLQAGDVVEALDGYAFTLLDVRSQYTESQD